MPCPSALAAGVPQRPAVALRSLSILAKRMAHFKPHITTCIMGIEPTTMSPNSRHSVPTMHNGRGVPHFGSVKKEMADILPRKTRYISSCFCSRFFTLNSQTRHCYSLRYSNASRSRVQLIPSAYPLEYNEDPGCLKTSLCRLSLRFYRHCSLVSWSTRIRGFFTSSTFSSYPSGSSRVAVLPSRASTVYPPS